MDGWLQSAGEYKGGSRITEGTGVRYNILVIQQLGLVITISGFNSHFTEGSDRRCMLSSGEMLFISSNNRH